MHERVNIKETYTAINIISLSLNIECVVALIKCQSARGAFHDLTDVPFEWLYTFSFFHFVFLFFLLNLIDN